VAIKWANIAGANIPELISIEFEDTDYDLYATPFWIDRGIIEIRELISLIIEVIIVKKQITILQRELQVTTQRVNLFEKVKIPESLENIRRIRIYLGDQQANAVGISKVAKKKVEIRNQEVLFA
jgi:V/A-type H+-transporting ATPase subunit D